MTVQEGQVSILGIPFGTYALIRHPDGRYRGSGLEARSLFWTVLGDPPGIHSWSVRDVRAPSGVVIGYSAPARWERAFPVWIRGQASNIPAYTELIQIEGPDGPDGSTLILRLQIERRSDDNSGRRHFETLRAQGIGEEIARELVLGWDRRPGEGTR